MLIQYCSDLHLEFPLNKNYVRKKPLSLAGEILLLAGDIIPMLQMDEAKEFFDFVGDHYQQVYWVTGNQEYYHSDIQLRTIHLEDKIRSNVTLINNKAIRYSGVRFIFSTLWSAISPPNESIIMKSMADLRNNSPEGHAAQTVG